MVIAATGSAAFTDLSDQGLDVRPELIRRVAPFAYRAGQSDHFRIVTPEWTKSDPYGKYK